MAQRRRDHPRRGARRCARSDSSARATNYVSYFLSACLRRAAAGPPGRRRRADRSADHRPGRPCSRRGAARRAVRRSCARTSSPRWRDCSRISRARRVNGSLERVNRYLAREGGPGGGAGRDDARAARRRARAPTPAKIIGHPQLGGLASHRPRAEAECLLDRATDWPRHVRRHAFGEHRPVAELETLVHAAARLSRVSRYRGGRRRRRAQAGRPWTTRARATEAGQRAVSCPISRRSG